MVRMHAIILNSPRNLLTAESLLSMHAAVRRRLLLLGAVPAVLHRWPVLLLLLVIKLPWSREDTGPGRIDGFVLSLSLIVCN